MEEIHQDIINKRCQKYGISGVFNNIARVEKEKLNIKEWNELNLEQWEDILNKYDDQQLQEIQIQDSGYIGYITKLPLDNTEVKKARSLEITDICTSGQCGKWPKSKAFSDPDWSRAPLDGKWVDVRNQMAATNPNG